MVPGGAITVAEFIIYYLNQRPKSKEAYRRTYAVPAEVTTETATDLFPFVADKFGKKDDSSSAKYTRLRLYSVFTEYAYVSWPRHIIAQFRQGHFGHFTLDDLASDAPVLETRPSSRAEEL